MSHVIRDMLHQFRGMFRMFRLWVSGCLERRKFSLCGGVTGGGASIVAERFSAYETYDDVQQ